MHHYNEQLWGIYCFADPQLARFTESLEGLHRLQGVVLSNATDEDLSRTGFDTPEDLAWRRGTAAYAYAGLLTAKATLRLQPALVAAVQMRLHPAPAYRSPHRSAYFKSLAAGREVLQEGTWKIQEIAAHLTGPEPDLLEALTGEFAYKAVRSSAEPQRPQQPQAVRTAAGAAGPGAAALAAPPVPARAAARR